MSRYRIEWQMGGEITVDTNGSDWTEDEVNDVTGQELLWIADDVADKVAAELEDCIANGDSGIDYKIQKLS